MHNAGITILLGLSVYQTIVNEKLPETSEAVPLLGKKTKNRMILDICFMKKCIRLKTL